MKDQRQVIFEYGETFDRKTAAAAKAREVCGALGPIVIEVEGKFVFAILTRNVGVTSRWIAEHCPDAHWRVTVAE
jgi:hypothetical protein